jgi:hypothetical protein
MFAERQDQILLAKPNLLLERKSLNVKVLFIIIKVRNMKNVSIWPKKKVCWFPLTLPGQFYPAGIE